MASKDGASAGVKDNEPAVVEAKKKSKAGKQARREKRLQERQIADAAGGELAEHAPAQSSKTGDVGKLLVASAGTEESSKGQGATGHVKEDSRAHLKRAGSSQVESHKTLPIRGTPKLTGPPTAVPSNTEKEVGLFTHLYGQPRRTTVAGAGREVHPAVLALGLQMSHYVICGSNARCIATLFSFKRVIESYTTPPGTTLTRHLTAHLSPQIEYLKSCRPLSVSMGNSIRWLKLEISQIDIDKPDAESKTELCESIDNFIRERITVADQVIAASAADKIRDGDVVLTYAKSSIVEKTLVAAHERGTAFRVVVVDSRPLFEGKNLARSLAARGLEVQYALVQAIAPVVKNATKVFLGAHAMMSNGGLFSRIGTAIVAMMAHDAGVPVIVCCESIKFTERVALDSIVHNELAPPDELVAPPVDEQWYRPPPEERPDGGAETHAPLSGLAGWHDIPGLQVLNLMYDVTPPEFIKMVITEHGSLPPSSVPVVHRLSTNT
ncbi:MAG: hypothetical protein M1826_004713 [Phylliscum demangeonii]|nr:MAG: hypothetical protein M1826_004713 [Phylliscum demangeonii]